MTRNKINEIYVIDTETSGKNGYPIDLVYEIGICLLKVKTGEIIPIYNEILGYDESELNKKQKNAWIFKNSTLTLDQVLDVKKAEIIANEVKQLIHKKYVAFFNSDFDYGKFMQYEPFLIKDSEDCYLLPCIMKELTPICKLPNPYFDTYKWPKLEEALEKLFTYKELQNFNHKLDRHRAISDAYDSAKCLFKMIKDHKFIDKIVEEK